MHARSALFDVYGDHLAGRGHEAPVAALVRMLEPVGVAAPAVRTAISRMVAQGWLEPRAVGRARGYRATPRAIRRLEEAAGRIYRREELPWDGAWQMVLVATPAPRRERDRLRAELGWLGFAPLGRRLWVSPHPAPGLAEALAVAGVDAVTWTATDLTPATRPLAAWDLDGLRAAYDAWLEQARTLLDRPHEGDADEAAFATRFELVHEWRKFLFTDPGLPERLLPHDWPGPEARRTFTEAADRLRPGSDRFVAHCLD
jgi:phenylacetic acid degradation operon negative regulatory protein